MLTPESVSSITAVCFKWPLLFFGIGVCVSWRLQVKGQNRAVWWKASDRKCHFNLSTAAAQPALAHCPARHVTFSSPETDWMCVKWMWKLLTSDRVLALPLLIPSLYSLLIFSLFCQECTLTKTVSDTPNPFCLFKFADSLNALKTKTNKQTKLALNVNIKTKKVHSTSLFVLLFHLRGYRTADYTSPNLVMRVFNSLRNSIHRAADSPQPPWVPAKDRARG